MFRGDVVSKVDLVPPGPFPSKADLWAGAANVSQLRGCCGTSSPLRAAHALFNFSGDSKLQAGKGDFLL